MEAMRKSWTDGRLDDFAANVDRRFDKIEIELHRINDRLDGMSKAIVFGAFTMTGAMLAGFAGMITLVATQT